MSATPATAQEENASSPKQNRGQKTDEKLEQEVKMAEGRAEAVIKEMKEELKDDSGLSGVWPDLVLDGVIMVRGKERSLTKALKYYQDACKLPPDMSLAQVRHKELELGNLMSIIIGELAAGNYAQDIFTEKKKDYLSKTPAKDARKSQAMIESALVKTHKEYRYVRGMWLSASLNKKFWAQMHEMVSSTFDRLRQVSITLSAEAKVDRFVNQDAPTGRGGQV